MKICRRIRVLSSEIVSATQGGSPIAVSRRRAATSRSAGRLAHLWSDAVGEELNCGDHSTGSPLSVSGLLGFGSPCQSPHDSSARPSAGEEEEPRGSDPCFFQRCRTLQRSTNSEAFPVPEASQCLLNANEQQLRLSHFGVVLPLLGAAARSLRVRPHVMFSNNDCRRQRSKSEREDPARGMLDSSRRVLALARAVLLWPCPTSNPTKHLQTDGTRQLEDPCLRLDARVRGIKFWKWKGWQKR